MPKLAPPRRLAGRTVALFSLFLLAALAIPVSAQAVWSSPFNLSDPGGDANVPRVAVDPNGNAVFVWQRYDGTTACGGSPCSRIQTRARSATGVLSAVQTLSPAGNHAFGPSVAVDSNGNAVFVWSRYDGTTTCGAFGSTPCSLIEARARSASGALTSPQVLSDAPGHLAGDARVGVDSSGNAVFAWESDGRIQGRARSAAGVLSSIQAISNPLRSAHRISDVAVDPSGNAVFVWAIYDESVVCGEEGCFRVQTRARSAGGSLSPIQNLSTYGNGYSAQYPDVAVDPNDNAVFIWQTTDGDPNCDVECVTSVQARARTAAGALSGAPILSAPGEAAFQGHVNVDSSGNAVFVWTHDDLTSGYLRIQARARSAAGTLGPRQELSDPGQVAQAPDLAVDPSGNAVFTWSRFDGSTNCGGGSPPFGGCLRVQARARSAAGALGAVQTLSAAGQDADYGYGHNVGVDQNGNAVATWARFGGANWRIQAAVGP